jgi:hypothetical protein
LWWGLLGLKHRLTVARIFVIGIVVAIGIIIGIVLILLPIGIARLGNASGGQVGSSLRILCLIRLRLIGLRRR